MNLDPLGLWFVASAYLGLVWFSLDALRRHDAPRWAWSLVSGLFAAVAVAFIYWLTP